MLKVNKLASPTFMMMATAADRAAFVMVGNGVVAAGFGGKSVMVIEMLIVVAGVLPFVRFSVSMSKRVHI